MFSFLDADAIFFAFTVSIESGDVKSISFVLFFITLPLRLVTPGISISEIQQWFNLLDLLQSAVQFPSAIFSNFKTFHSIFPYLETSSDSPLCCCVQITTWCWWCITFHSVLCSYKINLRVFSRLLLEFVIRIACDLLKTFLSCKIVTRLFFQVSNPRGRFSFFSIQFPIWRNVLSSFSLKLIIFSEFGKFNFTAKLS